MLNEVLNKVTIYCINSAQQIKMHKINILEFLLKRGLKWQLQQNFTSDMEVISNTVHNLTSSGKFPECDLSSLFHLAALEARKSQAQGRVFRVASPWL